MRRVLLIKSVGFLMSRSKSWSTCHNFVIVLSLNGRICFFRYDLITLIILTFICHFGRGSWQGRSSLHPDQYFTTTPLKMLKLIFIFIQHALINISNFSFSKTPMRGIQFQGWDSGLGNTQRNLVIWVFCLPDHCRNNLPIRFPQPLFCWRHLILKHLMKFG